MKDHVEKYLCKLGKEICRYMEQDVSERNMHMLDCMIAHREKIMQAMASMTTYDTGAGYRLTRADAEKWCASMVNSDGTSGGHWTIDQTSAVAHSAGVRFTHIEDWAWNAAMNMMYSDYCETAQRYGVNSADYYADMAKAFLFDADGGQPMDKLSAYYCWIVKPNM